MIFAPDLVATYQDSDGFLREGMDPALIIEILRDEALSDLFARRKELEAE